jgi:hypothetical protein
MKLKRPPSKKERKEQTIMRNVVFKCIYKNHQFEFYKSQDQ